MSMKKPVIFVSVIVCDEKTFLAKVGLAKVCDFQNLDQKLEPFSRNLD